MAVFPGKLNRVFAKLIQRAYTPIHGGAARRLHAAADALGRLEQHVELGRLGIAQPTHAQPVVTCRSPP